MRRDFRPLILIVLAVLVLMRSTSGGGVISPGTTTQVTYVYEKDQSSPPRAVQAALRALNEAGILATALDDDARTGEGEVPEQYKVALEAAKGKLPCLVIQAGDKVLKVIEKPTAEDVKVSTDTK